MRNFIAFIRHFRVILLFALLQGIALMWYTTFVSFPRSQYLTTASSFQGSILSVRNKLTQQFDLPKNNALLQAENIALHEQMPHSFVKLENGLVKINDTTHRLQYEYIPSVVINSTYSKANNYITINTGSSQGVKRGMGVFSSDGIVGVVHNVSAHFSVIKSCLTEKLNTAIMIEGSGEDGFLVWNGPDASKGTMTGVSNDSKITEKAKVITRGGAGIFPRGLPVGTVSQYKVIEGESLWNITFDFAVDFRSLQSVYVIKNLLLEEQKELEAISDGNE